MSGKGFRPVIGIRKNILIDIYLVDKLWIFRLLSVQGAIRSSNLPEMAIRYIPDDGQEHRQEIA
ncbi:MAG: hypothetical protein LUO93_00090 [Methanomicrobiales archaeon]|nr:hypothetical protein [Methanomicrobiales archaeon]